MQVIDARGRDRLDPTLAEFCARAAPMTAMPSAHRNIYLRY